MTNQTTSQSIDDHSSPPRPSSLVPRPSIVPSAPFWSRSSYFWSFAGVGALTPYTTLYYRDLGFNGLQVGILAALPSFFVAVCGPLWGSTADARGAHRFVLRTAQISSAVVVLVIAQVTHFWPMAVLVALLAGLNAPIGPILDSYGVTISERFSRSYGSLRVWGSVGYSATALTVGRIMGDDVTNGFLIAYAVCLGLGLLCSLGLPPQEERARRSFLSGIGLVRHNRPLLGLMLVAYLVASGGGIMYGFLGIHLKDLGGSANLVGAAVALGAASELPVVACGGWFLARFGPQRLIMIAISVYATRFLAFSLLPSAAWVFPIQLLHGLSFGAFLMATVTLAHRFAGRTNAATAQALLAASSFGLGSITGSLIGGALLDEVGTVWLFRGASALMLLTLTGFVILIRNQEPEVPDAPAAA